MRIGKDLDQEHAVRGGKEIDPCSPFIMTNFKRSDFTTAAIEDHELLSPIVWPFFKEVNSPLGDLQK